MRNKKFIMLLLMITTTLIIMAVPASPDLTVWTQSNGTKLNIQIKGDESINWVETTDGYKLLDDGTGNKVYAILNSTRDMVPSTVIASNPEARNTRENSFIRDLNKEIFFSSRQIENMKDNIPQRTMTRDGFPTVGTNNFIMILANFSDTSTSFGQADFDAYMNEEGYNGVGSFRDYYHEVSYEQLTVNTLVTEWVTVPWGHDDYQGQWGQFTRHAVDAAEAAGVDFSQFDNDGDGYVDGVAIIHQGAGQEASGDVTDIWSHSSGLQWSGLDVTYDGVTINAYTSQPEQYNGNVSTIGVMCHEFGHNLGAPDFYDTDYETGGSHVGTGRWDLMAGGSWNGSPAGSKPAHHNPLMKQFYGWTEFTSLDQYDTATWITVANSNEAPNFYIYETETNNEFFIIENRQQIGFNEPVPGHGLLFFHFDEDYLMNHAGNNDINATDHQGFYPRAYNNAINTAYCPLPGSYNLNAFHDWSNPNSINWAGIPTNKPITSITEVVDGDVSFYYLDENVPYTTCEITEPVENSLILPGEDITIVANPWHSLDSLDRVEFSVGGQLVGTVTSEPWEYTISSENYSGQILLGVIAYGTDGSWDGSDRYVEIVNSITIVAEDFEGMNSGDAAIPRWTFLDEDGLNNVSVPDVFVPFEGNPAGFFIFDNRNLGEDGPDALSGYHSLAVLKTDFEANDDWLISPLIHIDGGSYAQFYHTSLNGNTEPMQFRVLISGGSTDPADFFDPTGETIVESDDEWTMHRTMLSSFTGTDIRIAINCISENTGELLMIDNFIVLSANGAVSNDEEVLVPTNTLLNANYPNPFNPETTISYSLSKTGNVELAIYNILGQRVTTLVNDIQTSGNHSIIWKGEDSNGASVPSGVYFYKLSEGSYTKTRKMILLK
ncbi:MAG: M6 family metalloprotease domain-containing protein [Candidatus Zophobacter franzmannii]|nr:M6 family metalloprotease domain-containing protein [Candidatus Zophobacter franzmannii]